MHHASLPSPPPRRCRMLESGDRRSALKSPSRPSQANSRRAVVDLQGLSRRQLRLVSLTEEQFWSTLPANCGSAAAQAFSDDPFGNSDKAGSPYTPTVMALVEILWKSELQNRRHCDLNEFVMIQEMQPK